MSSVPPAFNPTAARQGLATVQAGLGESRIAESNSAQVQEAAASRSLPVSKVGNTPLANA